MNGLLDFLKKRPEFTTTGMNALQQNQALGMNPSLQNNMTGLSPQQQASMVTGRPEVGPTGMNPDQMKDIIGDISSSGIPMDQVLAAMSAIDSGPQQMMPGQIFNNRGNVLVPGPMQQQPSMASQIGPLAQMIQPPGAGSTPESGPSLGQLPSGMGGPSGSPSDFNSENFGAMPGILDMIAKFKSVF